MKVGFAFILVVFIGSVAQSQARPKQSDLSTPNSLTVRVTVVPSVWLVMEPDGTRKVVVANAPDARESFSHAPTTKDRKKHAALAKGETSSTVIQKALTNQGDNAVQFSFPSVSKRFELTQKTVTMSVFEGGKTEARAVTVTTIVAQ